MTHHPLAPLRTMSRPATGLATALVVALAPAACNRRRAPEADPAPAVSPTVTPATTPAVDILWNANAVQYRGQNGAIMALRCPPGGAAATVWGTDLYSDDSSICTAALHSGRVTLEGGGVIQIAIAPGSPSYQGSVRNNVTALNYGPFPGSFTIVGGAAPGLATTALPATPTNPWAENAVRYRGRNGEEIPVFCPPGGAPAAVWGTDVYTDDSSICTAALHAGRITGAGGAVTLHVRAGQGSYRGSARNGVTTQDFARFPGSFVFDPNVAGEAPAPAGTTGLQWGSNATEYRGRDGERVHVYCPPGGSAGTVWGTRVYTDDSSVCTAAVHAGLATFEQGGTFTLRVASGKSRYRGSSANGVTTQDFAAYPGSFTLSR